MLLNNGGFGYVVVCLQDGSDSKVAVGVKEMYLFVYKGTMYKRKSNYNRLIKAEEKF